MYVGRNLKKDTEFKSSPFSYYLSSVEFGPNVTEIIPYMFDECCWYTIYGDVIEGLTEVLIDGDIESIGESAFADCGALARFDVPESVTFIGDNAFNGCIGLAYFDIPAATDYVGASAFEGCTGLTSLRFGSGSELGDIAKACGVKYDIGMDDRDISGEDIAPEDANDVIQDITYVAILKDFGEKDMTIEKPAGYDPSIFYCTCKNDLCSNPDRGTVLWEKHQMITYGKLPNNKYMINWPINGNDYYVNMIEMDKEQRDSALQVLKNFTLSYVYFMQTELGFKNLGLADDEYPTADKLPFIPYHRESRRGRAGRPP